MLPPVHDEAVAADGGPGQGGVFEEEFCVGSRPPRVQVFRVFLVLVLLIFAVIVLIVLYMSHCHNLAGGREKITRTLLGTSDR